MVDEDFVLCPLFFSVLKIFSIPMRSATFFFAGNAMS